MRRAERRGERRGRIRRATTRLAPFALGALVVIAPQLLGGVFGWGIAIIAALAAVGCLAAAWASRADSHAAPLGPVGWAALLACGWTLVQATPLPRGLTALLQPQAIELADGSAGLLGQTPPGWVALSIAPGSTWTQVVQGAGLLAAFLAASMLVALGHRRRVLAAVGVSGLVMASVGLLHAAVDADRVFGIYDPIHDTSPLLAPIVNQNQLSGFLGMCAPLLVGLGLDRQEPRVRWAWLAAGTVVGACTLMAVSRGGAASLVVGFLTLALFGSLSHRAKQGRSAGAPLLLIGAALATAVGLGLYVAADALYRDFETGGFEKIELASMGLELALEHPFVGVGRGAFSAAFVSRLGTTTRATNPENLPAQWASEWGLVVALILLVVVAWSILRASRRATTWAHLGGAAGLVGVFAHDQVDFCLELAGVAVVAAVLLGAVVTESRRRHTARPRVSVGRVGAAAGVLTLLLVLVVGASLDRRSVFGLQQTLEAQMRAGDETSFRDTLAEAVEIHPSEPAFALLAGSEAGQRGHPDALRWLNRAMLLAPGWGAPHEEAARYLIVTGHLGQALLEIREAGERDRLAASDLACPPLERHPEHAPRAVLLLGADPLGDALLERIAICLPRTSPAALTIDAHLVDRRVLGARIRTARRSLDDGQPATALALLEDVEGDDPRVLGVIARAHLAAGHPERAVEVLRGRESTGLVELRARAEAAARDEPAMLVTLEQLRGRAAGSARRIARVWLLEGELHEGLGNDFAALRAYGRAERMDPASEGLVRSARVAERVGDLGRSYRAYGDLCQRNGARSGACRHRDRLLQQLRESRRQAGQPLGAP